MRNPAAPAGQPHALVEVGESAGLCLCPNRYSYRFTTSMGEHRLGETEIVLPCAVTGPAPLPEQLPDVMWRAGLDLNPLQADRDRDRRWLASLIWPEQIDRAQHLEQSLDLSPPTRHGWTPQTCSSTSLDCSPTHRRAPRWSSSTQRWLRTWIKISAGDSPISCTP